MHISRAPFQHTALVWVLCVRGLLSVALISVAVSTGIFQGDAGSLVRAGWHAGMLGSGLIFVRCFSCS